MGSVHLLQQAKQLRAERVEHIEKARDILDKAEGESRDLNTEERSEYDKLVEAADEMKPRYERLEAQAERESEMADAQYRSRDLAKSQRSEDGDDPVAGALTAAQRVKALRGSEEYQRAFDAYLVRGEGALAPEQAALLHNAELRAQTIGTGSEGGFTTSTDTEGRIVEALGVEVAMRALGTVIPIASDREIPVVDAPADYGDPALTAESAAYNEDDVVLEQRTLGAFKLTRLVRASEELVADDDAGFMALLPSFIARRFGPSEEAWFVNGTGSSQPRGVLLDAPVGVTAASATAVTADELIDHQHTVRRPYRPRSSWLMNDQTIRDIRKLKDGDNQYLWRMGLEPGASETLLGKPVFTSASMPLMATGLKAVAYGDFSYYWIGDRGQRSVKRLVERYAELGQIGFVASQRTDGVLTVQESVKHLLMG